MADHEGEDGFWVDEDDGLPPHWVPASDVTPVYADTGRRCSFRVAEVFEGAGETTAKAWLLWVLAYLGPCACLETYCWLSHRACIGHLCLLQVETQVAHLTVVSLAVHVRGGGVIAQFAPWFSSCSPPRAGALTLGSLTSAGPRGLTAAHMI